MHSIVRSMVKLGSDFDKRFARARRHGTLCVRGVTTEISTACVVWGRTGEARKNVSEGKSAALRLSSQSSSGQGRAAEQISELATAVSRSTHGVVDAELGVLTSEMTSIIP
jgi:hypothetical protein